MWLSIPEPFFLGDVGLVCSFMGKKGADRDIVLADNSSSGCLFLD